MSFEAVLKAPKQGHRCSARVPRRSVSYEVDVLRFPNGLESLCEDADSVSWF